MSTIKSYQEIICLRCNKQFKTKWFLHRHFEKKKICKANILDVTYEDMRHHYKELLTPYKLCCQDNKDNKDNKDNNELNNSLYICKLKKVKEINCEHCEYCHKKFTHINNYYRHRKHRCKKNPKSNSTTIINNYNIQNIQNNITINNFGEENIVIYKQQQ